MIIEALKWRCEEINTHYISILYNMKFSLGDFQNLFLQLQSDDWWFIVNLTMRT